MKSSSERTLPSAVSSRPDTSSRTGAATSTVTRAAERGMFEPGVIAVMPRERARPFCRSLTKRPIGPAVKSPARNPSRGLRNHHDLPAHPGRELLQRLRIPLQLDPVADEDLRVEHAVREQLRRPLEA